MGFFGFGSKKIQQQDFCIKPGYIINASAGYYLDTENTFVYQPDVYELAYYLAKRTAVKNIIDIGSGNGLKLQKFLPEFNIICIDYGENRNIIENNLPNIEFIEANLENGLPTFAKSVLQDAIVIISDVIEHIVDPDKLLTSLSVLSHRCPYVLISTPDRVKCRGIGDFGPPSNNCHVREWQLDEFYSLLIKYHYNAFMLGYTVNTDYHLQKNTILAVSGTHVYRPGGKLVKVLAVINTYNEGDIIRETVQHLLDQQVDVHVVDNWSTDDSYEKVVAMQQQQPDRIFITRFPAQPSPHYEWENLLKNTVDIATQSSYDWIMHQDADEMRESPWKDITLREAITFIDSLGFNTIDSTVLDFRPVEPDRADNINPPIIYFEFGKRSGHFAQMKTWKNKPGLAVDLASSGGHVVAFAEQRIYPIKFITRHYPLRSQQQAKNKIFADRLQRFLPEEKQGKGWHIQYDHFKQEDTFVWDRNTLISWNRHTFDIEYFVERISGIGIVRNKDQ
jgi:glycosyltransferase involved in cell wall biosynthesis